MVSSSLPLPVAFFIHLPASWKHHHYFTTAAVIPTSFSFILNLGYPLIFTKKKSTVDSARKSSSSPSSPNCIGNITCLFHRLLLKKIHRQLRLILQREQRNITHFNKVLWQLLKYFLPHQDTLVLNIKRKTAFWFGEFTFPRKFLVRVWPSKIPVFFLGDTKGNLHRCLFCFSDT